MESTELKTKILKLEQQLEKLKKQAKIKDLNEELTKNRKETKQDKSNPHKQAMKKIIKNNFKKTNHPAIKLKIYNELKRDEKAVDDFVENLREETGIKKEPQKDKWTPEQRYFVAIGCKKVYKELTKWIGREIETENKKRHLPYTEIDLGIIDKIDYSPDNIEVIEE